MSDSRGMQPELFTAVIGFAQLGLKTVVLVNGAAIIGVMTFVGHVWGNSSFAGRELARLLFVPILAFVAGLILALIAVTLAYVTQAIYGELSSPADTRIGNKWRIAAFVTAVLGVAAFAFGSIGTLMALAR